MFDLRELCDLTTVLVGASVGLLIFWMFKGGRPKNFPPGPRGLPIVGSALFMGNNAGETLMKLKKKYGTVMSVKMGKEYWVVLNDLETINEGLVKQGERFSGRSRNYAFDLIGDGLGIISLDYGTTWKSLRKFGLLTLRGFGVGKKSMEENVKEETNYFLEYLENSNKNQALRKRISLAVSNIICRIVFGSRFDYEDQRFHTLLRVIDVYFSDSSEAKIMGMINFAPFLRYLPGFRGAVDSVLNGFKDLKNILQEIIDDHKKTFVKDDLRDFIDAFLKEINEKGQDDPSFNETQMLNYIRDLFEAGSGTTSSTLLWSIFTLCHHSDIQEKLAKEVHNVIGESGTVTMENRDQMPYTCAFIHEIMRLKTLVPILFHKTTEDARLSGFDIPKETTISPNLWAVHHNPIIFPDPDSFRPERFIDKDGKFVKSSHVIPFSVGPRHCLAKQLVRMELFIFLTSIVQKLKITPDPNVEFPPYENSGQSNGVTFECPDFKVVFEKR